MEYLNQKKFNNHFVEHFPGDNTKNLSPRQTPGVLYSRVEPTPVKQPKLIGWSDDLALKTNIKFPNQEDIAILGGNKTTKTMKPYAACYAGHQFGNWAGQLGDGRAITLGEIEAEDKWELQLKGVGPTPYSRMADGRAVLRSSVREFLVSEAMYHLGVPTTRALSLVSTGEEILRDMFYDGNPQYEPGAIVARMAPSFLRFGSFELLAARNEIENLKKLVDWTINNHFPHITGADRTLKWFEEVVTKTASLMAEWHRVGFVHGVMNTDNMSILGLTIDYGPFSFLDEYDFDFTPNTTDLPGRRYAFGKQAFVAYWNLGCLANAIAPLCEDTTTLKTVLESYEDHYYKHYYAVMGKKLGLDEVTNKDKELIGHFENTLSSLKLDASIFYRLLIDFPLNFGSEKTIISHFEKSFYHQPDKTQSSLLYSLMISYQERLRENTIPREKSQKMMKNNNPFFVLRNYLLFQAIEELENGDSTLFQKLKEAIKAPYSEAYPEFFKQRPEWANKKAGCSMLSCSS